MSFENSLITINGLSLNIGSAPILRNISLNINRGETLGVVGANGAGKTSLLRCLYRYYGSRRSCITLDGTDILDIPTIEYAKRVSALCSQHDGHFDFYVHEIISMSDNLYGLHDNLNQEMNKYRHKIKNCLQIDELWQRGFNSLSSGEKQRVMIARALWHRPEVIILDEPTCYLDVYYRYRLLELLYHGQMTAIIATHDSDLVRRLCNRIVCMQKGHIAMVQDNCRAGIDDDSTAVMRGKYYMYGVHYFGKV